jgi:anti-anti-sigma factor
MTDLDENPSPFELRESRASDEVRLELRGELDLGVGDEVRRALERAAAEQPGRIVVDISGLTFMDSTGLGLLVQARENARTAGRQFCLTQPRAQVRRLFEITGVLDGFVLVNADGR